MTARYTRPPFSARPTYHCAVEEWRPVLRYEQRYEVSNWGRVRSIYWKGKPRTPRVLRCSLTGRGYPSIQLCNGEGAITRPVHRIVVEAFTGQPIPAGMEVNHIDADRTNNRTSNLEIVTGLENARHKSALDRHIYGERNKQTTLKEADVRAIRALRAEGRQYKEIAAIYGISTESAFDVAQGRRWKHVA